MAGYIGTQPVPNATRYLAWGKFEAPQQVITIPGGYTVNNIVVLINGFTLNPDEYTATDGMTVDLGVEFDAGTSWRVEEFRTYEVANHYTKQESDAKYAKLNEANDFTLMPTVGGAPIVESGSNSDGEWTKWADGTQICKAFKVASSAANNSIGSVYGTAGDQWDFPVVFYGEYPAISGICSKSVGRAWVGLGGLAINGTYTSWVVFTPTTSSSVPTAALMAVGRWK